MQYTQLNTVSSIMSELEGTWKNFDAIYATFSPQDWSRKFGRTWTYAEQPYHLAYFDRFHAEYIKKGTNVTEAEKEKFSTLNMLNGWNAREFAKRPVGQTVEQSLKQMHESRDAVRQIAAKMTDKDLDNKMWSCLLCGWVKVGDILKGNIIHNVGEYTKLWLRTGKKGPALNPTVVHLRLNMMTQFMSSTFNREAAGNTRFTMVWNFDGAGGGQWTLRVADGKCALTEENAANPDLTITMKPETLQKMVAKMELPMWLMLSGQMKVKGFGAMKTFGKLFPEPKPDQVLITGPEMLVMG